LMKTYRYLLAGLGNIGRSFLEIVAERDSVLRQRYGIELQCVAVGDSSGMLINAEGIDTLAIARAKRQKHSLSGVHGSWLMDAAPVAALDNVDLNLVLDATPMNMTTGEPGLSLTRQALQRGINVVTANKAPLALNFAGLAGMSDWRKPGAPRLRFSACVGGAMPTINVGVFDLPCARFKRIEAVLNGTTQLILEMMANDSTYEEAVRAAQRMGIAETDPRMDVEGWDAANKLVILANTVLGIPASLADVSVTGIGPATANEAKAAKIVGERLSLLATAERDGEGFKLTVAPTPLPTTHPFGNLTGAEMGVIYETDIYEKITVISHETGPVPSAAAMLRDIVNIAIGI
jgi:homoserine dehydrogenase